MEFWNSLSNLQLIVLFPLFTNAQLNEFEVIKMEQPDVPVIQANTQFPDDALLLVYSSLGGLQFRSSLGGIDKQSYNATAGRYEVLIEPLKQMIFVAKIGCRERKLTTLNPEKKDVFYYSVELLQSEDEQRLQELNSLLKKGILTSEQYENFVAKVKGLEDETKDETTQRVGSQKHNELEENSIFKCVDPAGREYRTVKIGNQVWMAENLAYKPPVKQYTYIPSGGNHWAYDDKNSNVEMYGYLYSETTAKNSCPSGWHLPSKDEWETLIDQLGGYEIAGEKLKSIEGWDQSGNGTNESGFGGFPGGARYAKDTYSGIGLYGRWWSSSKTKMKKASGNPMVFRLRSGSSSAVLWKSESVVSGGYSVRCVKD